LAGTGLLVLLLVLLAALVDWVDRVGGRGRDLPVLDGAAAGFGRAGEGGEPFQVLRCAQPRRRVGRTALQVLLRHRSLLMGWTATAGCAGVSMGSRPG
jgi:hypothetical protein